MEELDLLKKDWKKQEAQQPKLSYDDIDNMMLKKSSSLIKWVFYVSILELGFGIAILILALLVQPDLLHDSNMPYWLNGFFYLSSAAVFYFIYKFYINYKKISSTSSIKELMQNIISTRRTVKHYIMYSLSIIALTVCIAFPTGYIEKAGGMDTFKAHASMSQYLMIAVGTIVAACLVVALFYGVYYLLYGLLTKKLKRNFKELHQLKS